MDPWLIPPTKFRENSIGLLPLIFFFLDPASCTTKRTKMLRFRILSEPFCVIHERLFHGMFPLLQLKNLLLWRLVVWHSGVFFLRGFQLTTLSAQWNRWVYRTLKSDKHIFQWFSRKNSASERKIATTKSIACVNVTDHGGGMNQSVRPRVSHIPCIANLLHLSFLVVFWE